MVFPIYNLRTERVAYRGYAKMSRVKLAGLYRGAVADWAVSVRQALAKPGESLIVISLPSNAFD